MLGEKIVGKLTGVKAGIETTEQIDGSKEKKPIYEIKIESSDIDYAELNQFAPNISTVMLAIQPYCFKSCNFGEFNGKYRLKLWARGEENNLPGLDCDGEYVYVEITNFSVSIRENIPTFTFVLAMDMAKNPNGAFLFKAVKTIVEFEFSEQ
jgi:hypothetical protein